CGLRVLFPTIPWPLQWHCADPIDLAHEHRPSSRFLAPRGNTRQKTPLRPAVLRQEELSAVQVDPAAAMALAPVLVAAHHRQIRPGCAQNLMPVPAAALQQPEMVMVDTHPPEAPIHTL